MKTQNKIIEYSRWIAEGICVGLASAAVVAVYHVSLTRSEALLASIWDFIRGHALYITVWFAFLLLLSVLVGALLRIEANAGGSGLVQLILEYNGKLDLCWWRIILVKIPAAALCALGGLSLGQAGPSIHMGAMSAKGVSLIPGGGRDRQENRLRLFCCGAGAGLTATFHVPLAGLFFILEKLHGRFDTSFVITGMSATLSADLMTRMLFGSKTAFSYQAVDIPFTCWWILPLFGILLGLAGAFYNFSMGRMQRLFKRFPQIPMEVRLMVPFLCAGVLGLLLPQVIGNGSRMSALIMSQRPALSILVLLLAVKFIFSVICTGSGAPGGVFSPMFVMGAYLGAVFGSLAITGLSLDPNLWTQFILLGMTGFFAGIFRLPITAVVIVAEINGSITGLPTAIIVALTAYATANLTHTGSIIRELMGNK